MESEPTSTLTDLAYMTRTDKADAARILDEAAIPKEPGPNNSHLYPTKKSVRALIDVKMSKDRSSLEEARTQDALASARLKCLQAEKLEGLLADIGQVLEWQNVIFDRIATTIKESVLSEAEKEDILTTISNAAREWEKMS